MFNFLVIKHVQNETTMRYHFTFFGLAKIWFWGSRTLDRIYSTANSRIPVKVEAGTMTLENNLALFDNVLYCRTQQFYSRYTTSLCYVHQKSYKRMFIATLPFSISKKVAVQYPGTREGKGCDTVIQLSNI